MIAPLDVLVYLQAGGFVKWSPEQDLNLQHPVYKTGALPIELSGLEMITPVRYSQ